MGARTEDMIVYLPTGNKTGSVKMLNLSTGMIVTRDNFKILPMPQSVKILLNSMAKRDGRFPTIPNSIHDLVYNQSVNNANMPTFMPILPPNRVDTPAAQIPDNMTVLADLPSLLHNPNPNINQNEVGGNAAPLPLERVLDDVQPDPYDGDGSDQEQDMVHDADTPPVLESDIYMDDSEHGPETHPVQGPGSPPPEDRADQRAVPLNSPQRVPARKVMDFFRTGEGAMVASEADTESKTVKLSGSAVEEIEEVLAQKKKVTFTDPGANVRVKEALRTRGDEAKRVINKELQQMLDRKVWEPVISDRLAQ